MAVAVGGREFFSLFDTVDVKATGSLDASQVKEFYEALYLCEVSDAFVENSIRAICNADTCAREEFVDVVQELERRRRIADSLRWDFALMDHDHRGSIHVRDAQTLFRIRLPPHTAQGAWDRFVAQRTTKDARVSLTEIEELIVSETVSSSEFSLPKASETQVEIDSTRGRIRRPSVNPDEIIRSLRDQYGGSESRAAAERDRQDAAARERLEGRRGKRGDNLTGAARLLADAGKQHSDLESRLAEERGRQDDKVKARLAQKKIKRNAESNTNIDAIEAADMAIDLNADDDNGGADGHDDHGTSLAREESEDVGVSAEAGAGVASGDGRRRVERSGPSDADRDAVLANLKGRRDKDMTEKERQDALLEERLRSRQAKRDDTIVGASSVLSAAERDRLAKEGANASEKEKQEEKIREKLARLKSRKKDRASSAHGDGGGSGNDSAHSDDASASASESDGKAVNNNDSGSDGGDSGDNSGVDGTREGRPRTAAKNRTAEEMEAEKDRVMEGLKAQMDGAESRAAKEKDRQDAAVRERLSRRKTQKEDSMIATTAVLTEAERQKAGLAQTVAKEKEKQDEKMRARLAARRKKEAAVGAHASDDDSDDADDAQGTHRQEAAQGAASHAHATENDTTEASTAHATQNNNDNAEKESLVESNVGTVAAVEGTAARRGSRPLSSREKSMEETEMEKEELLATMRRQQTDLERKVHGDRERQDSASRQRLEQRRNEKGDKLVKANNVLTQGQREKSDLADSLEGEKARQESKLNQKIEERKKKKRESTMDAGEGAEAQ